MSNRDVELLYELGTLRHVGRTWTQFGGVNFANVADHSFRVAWLAMIIGRREGANLGHIAQMAILHDIAETRTGDVNYVSRMYTSRKEDEAMKDITSETSLDENAQQLWAEYEKRETLEARCVKDADSLDCDLELREQEANGVRMGEVLKQTRLAVRERLFTDTGRQLFDEIYSSDPHSWHSKGVNRLTVGDWKKK